MALWRVGEGMFRSTRDLRFGLGMLQHTLRTIRTDFLACPTILVPSQPDSQVDRHFDTQKTSKMEKSNFVEKMEVIFRPIRDLLNRLGVVSERLGHFLRSKTKDQK